jgi:hypothetical protein|tara:strand:- start:1275 stop:1556 length:282 start_codon:yes stop_codon:yes gene_type:complete
MNRETHSTTVLTLMKKINWSLKMSKGGFKHTRAREPNSRDRKWLEKLQLKLLQEKELNRKDTERLDYLYSESFLMGLDDNLNVTVTIVEKPAV